MDRTRFNEIVKETLQQVDEILIKKGKEYSGNVDVFKNFRIAAVADESTPEEALWGMYMKHWVSIRQIVKDGELPSKELLNEKILDSIAYMILLKGIIIEQIEEEQQ